MSSMPVLKNAPDEGRILSFLSGNLAQVDVAKIEKELTRLWDSAGRAAGDEDVAWKPVIRACALNMVLLCEEENERKFAGLLSEITVRHPCRAILAVIAQAPVEKVEAWVTAHCHFLPGRLDKQMCCEQISVKWSGAAFVSTGLASVVTPLVIPELPSWLFAGSKQLTSAVMEPFLSYLDHLLMDSRIQDAGDTISEGALAALSSNLQIAIDLAEHTVVVDLAWLTISAWRKAIALAFDNTDVSILPTRLKAVKTITVQYGGQSQGFSQALLLATWLTTRLQLTPQNAEFKEGLDNRAELTAVCSNKGGQSLTVTLQAAEDGAIGVNGFEMAFSDGDDVLNVDFSCGALKVTNNGSEEFMELPWSSSRDKNGEGEPAFTELVDFAFEHSAKDPIYLAAAKSANDLLKLINRASK